MPRFSMAVGASLVSQLRGAPCRVYSSDLRVRVLATGLATYPAVTVVCGESKLDPESTTTIVNPHLVVEVPSDSTRDYDRIGARSSTTIAGFLRCGRS
jgi:Uma2 family endonuclease